MHNDVAVNIQNTSVRFNMATERVDTIKEYVIRLLKGNMFFQEFFALKDVYLEIKKGEAWGIIGENGAGKSTLLKLISGILKPYKGEVHVYGKISPLIELGAGFDPEMTARENIYLNGCVLGYQEFFIKEKFDEIVDFAEVGQFLDSPIKNFSSGMSARLGFAIATVVKPDILIVDEVLSVGDYAFQRKCEKRIEELLIGGTTLLYVSHSIDSIRNMCKKAIWLESGIVKMCGDVEIVCDEYIREQAFKAEI